MGGAPPLGTPLQQRRTGGLGEITPTDYQAPGGWVNSFLEGAQGLGHEHPRPPKLYPKIIMASDTSLPPTLDLTKFPLPKPQAGVLGICATSPAHLPNPKQSISQHQVWGGTGGLGNAVHSISSTGGMGKRFLQGGTGGLEILKRPKLAHQGVQIILLARVPRGGCLL